GRPGAGEPIRRRQAGRGNSRRSLQFAGRRQPNSERAALSTTMSYFAPAGTPVTLRDIAHGAARAARDPDSASRLTAAIRNVSGRAHAWSVSSGRAAMTVILRAMRAAAGRSDRREVIIPAYT